MFFYFECKVENLRCRPCLLLFNILVIIKLIKMNNQEEKKSFRPVDYNEYKDGYTPELCELFKNNQITDIEQMRRLMYGYTFTPDYARVGGQHLFSTRSWSEDEYPSQQDMIIEAIASTGDGLTPETAWYVIDVYQEYDFIDYYDLGQMMNQTVRNHIDCLELLTPDGIKKYYFNIQRRFEVGYCHTDFVHDVDLEILLNRFQADNGDDDLNASIPELE